MHKVLYPQRLRDAQRAHPEITVEGDTATGIWYLQDIFVELNHNVTIMGSALYDDAYRKESGEWKIARTELPDVEYHPRGDDIKLRLKPIHEAESG